MPAPHDLAGQLKGSEMADITFRDRCALAFIAKVDAENFLPEDTLDGKPFDGSKLYDILAEHAYAFADSMMAEREKK